MHSNISFSSYCLIVGSRAVGDDRYSLLAFNRVDENGAFVCKEGSGTLPEEDCFDSHTGIYEHVVDVR